MSDHESARPTIGRLFAFFVPLGLSASLVTVSHVIINSTLARSAHPEIVISSYAIGLSMIGIIERPGVLLRQTCSALVRDRVSFRAISWIALYLFVGMMAVGGAISYTPLGEWLFLYAFGVNPELLPAIIDVYRVLMFVAVFSGLRCLFHGIIISHLRTKWLTIGMIVRLAAMYLLSLYYIRTGVHSGTVGAIIFLVGMIIEALIAVWEGTKLLRAFPEKKEGHPIERMTDILPFYRPLFFSSLIVVTVAPLINAMLGKTVNVELAISSFAIAASLTQLVQSFFSYMHQIALNFFQKDPRQVLRFALMCGFIPSILIGLLSYTPLGPWFMGRVMGVGEQLAAASLQTLRIFMVLTLIFPWLDFCNGILMLKRQTKVMLWSQSLNVALTFFTLVLCVYFAPHWNGAIGSLAQSVGAAGEFGVVLYVLKTIGKSARSFPAIGTGSRPGAEA